jgi:hypothetical protein
MAEGLDAHADSVRLRMADLADNTAEGADA